MCDLDVTGAPSIFKIIHSAGALGPTSLTSAPIHLLCFHFVCCAKEVIDLINHPVVSLIVTVMTPTGLCVVYYESIKRDLNTKPIYECRCDERLFTMNREIERYREDL